MFGQGNMSDGVPVLSSASGTCHATTENSTEDCGAGRFKGLEEHEEERLALPDIAGATRYPNRPLAFGHAGVFRFLTC